jgi:hypothetical protein
MRPVRAASTLDFDFVRRVCIYIAVIGTITGPFSPDPVALIGGSMIPWVLVRIIGTPTMPAAVLYIFLWQWMQVFARALQSCVDKESLSSSIYGPDVTRAYWYMMASLVVMAFAFRAVLGNLKPPTRAQATAHFRWQVPDIVIVYAGAMVSPRSRSAPCPRWRRSSTALPASRSSPCSCCSPTACRPAAGRPSCWASSCSRS